MSEEKTVKLFLRKGKNGGLYFFSKSGKLIFFMNASDVQDLIEGKRDWVVITGKLAKKDMED